MPKTLIAEPMKESEEKALGPATALTCGALQSATNDFDLDPLQFGIETLAGFRLYNPKPRSPSRIPKPLNPKFSKLLNPKLLNPIRAPKLLNSKPKNTKPYTLKLLNPGNSRTP